MHALQGRRFPSVSRAVFIFNAGAYARPLWQIDHEHEPTHLQTSSVDLDFTLGDAFAEAFDAVDFVHEEMEIDRLDIPSGGTGNRSVEILEFGIGRDIVFHELLRQFGLAKRKCVFCPPLGVIKYALEVKKCALEHPLVTVFTGPNSLQYKLEVYGLAGGLGVKVERLSIDSVFDQHVDFLMVDRTNESR